MIQTANDKSFFKACRIFTMEAMQIALRIYKESKDEQFYEHAKNLGQQSMWYKEQIEKLSY